MAAQIVTPADRLEMRAIYEDSPAVTVAEIGDKYGVTEQRISQIAREEGWKPRDNSREPSGEAPDLFTPAQAHEAKRAGEEEKRIEAIRTEHREQWGKVRELISKAMIYGPTKDGKKGKLIGAERETLRAAKDMAQALMTMQEGERAAFGLDAADAGKGGGNVFVAVTFEDAFPPARRAELDRVIEVLPNPAAQETRATLAETVGPLAPLPDAPMEPPEDPERGQAIVVKIGR